MLVVDDRVGEATLPRGRPGAPEYGLSVLCCLPNGRAAPTPDSSATGTVLRPKTLRAYAEQAGFGRVEALPVEHDLFRLTASTCSEKREHRFQTALELGRRTPADGRQVGTCSCTDPTLLKPGGTRRRPHPPRPASPTTTSRFPVVEVDSTYYPFPSERNAVLLAPSAPRPLPPSTSRPSA